MALFDKKEINSSTLFGIWKIEETIEDLQAKLLLSKHDEVFLKTLHHNKRKLHWLSARVLLKVLLNTHSYIEYNIDEHGKPFLVNFPYHISISHSFDYAAVILSENQKVGIDIEHISYKIKHLAPKFLSSTELLFIDKNYIIDQLYACWCTKEAIYKLYGKRQVSFLKQIQLNPFTYQHNGEISVDLFVDGMKHNFTAYFEKFDNYMISYVLE